MTNINGDSVVHLVPREDEETNEEEPSEDGPLKKYKDDILYYLKVAGVANRWSYQLERTSGSESEDAEERQRKSKEYFAFIDAAKEEFKKRMREEEMECGIHHPKRLRQLPPSPNRALNNENSTKQETSWIKPGPFDIHDESTWGNRPSRCPQSEEEIHLREAHDDAVEAVKSICSLEQIEVEERVRRIRKLGNIYSGARRDMMRKNILKDYHSRLS